MITIGIDDTDTLNTPGTNQLARGLMERIAGDYETMLILRHQLLVDPRIPFTSHNGSASILVRPRRPGLDPAFLSRTILEGMREWFIEGSDPGYCIVHGAVPGAVSDFGLRCQQEVMRQEDARALAKRFEIELVAVGGTGGGIIGAIAAVGLAATGDDGRIVQLGSLPDDLTGPQPIEAILGRGVDRILDVESREPIRRGTIDLGKRLRPNRRRREVILYACRNNDAADPNCEWTAVRVP